MSALVTINIEGLGEVPVHAEYTDPAVKDAYAANIQPIIDAFNRGRLVLDEDGNLIAADPQVGGSLSAADVQAIKDALPILLDLAENGLDVGGETFYLTIEMGQAVKLIQSGLDAAGFNPIATDAANIDAIKRWQDMANVGMEEIVINAGAAIFSNKSLQSLIELEYVKTGNEVIGGNLSSLRDALEVTKDILNTLERIQDLHNLIGVPERDEDKFEELQDFLERTRSGATSFNTIKDFTDIFEPLADDFFDYIEATINPEFFQEVVTLDGTTLDGVNDEVVTQFLEVREDLSRQLALLRNINGTPPGGPDEENSLAEKLQTILDDMALTSNIDSPIFEYLESTIPGFPGTTSINAGMVFDAIEGSPTAWDYFTSSSAIRDAVERGLVSGPENPLHDRISRVLGRDPDQDGYTVNLTKSEAIDLFEDENGFTPSDAQLATYINTLVSTEQIADFDSGDLLLPFNIGQTIAIGNQPVEINVGRYEEDAIFNISEKEQNLNHSVALWVLDLFDVGDSIDTGNIQRRLTEGITSAESLNDRQKEDLRRFMFVFEEYYKSASAVLQSITRMIERMAQGIKQ